MKIYILHYASIDCDGGLNINCQKYSNIEDAKCAQEKSIEDFINNHSFMSDYLIKEKIGSFQRIAYEDYTEELQTHIEVFEV